MTHQEPNLANVPAKGALFGEECRRVFVADEGWVQVGADAEQLELRCLAKRLSPYDGGAYAEEVMHGDVHTLHVSVAAGIDRDLVTVTIRKGGKTVTYAWLYGAGDGKLAASYKGIPDVPKRSGKQIRQGYEQGITGVAQLLSRLKAMLKQWGAIKALDGGKLYSRSSHSVLNLQLQSDGALIMKVALIFADQLLAEAGLTEGRDFKWVGNIHDELQATSKREYAETVGQAMVDGMRMAGEWFDFPVPIDGKFMIGDSWAETH
jgi:DNA polymerase I-like protein with 3'-5' exonuclease and polymerase domains